MATNNRPQLSEGERAAQQKKARRVAFRRRVNGWWEQAWRPTKERITRSDDDLLLAAGAAIVAAAVAVHDQITDNPFLAFSTALGAATTALAAYLFLILAINVIRAPKRLRRDRAWPPGEFFNGLMRMHGKVRDTDVMQREATIVASAIDTYQQTIAKPGRVPQPSDLKIVPDAIWRFGERARRDEWISWRARRRSLALFREISETDDLDLVRKKCLDFQKLKPRH